MNSKERVMNILNRKKWIAMLSGQEYHMKKQKRYIIHTSTWIMI